MRTCQHHQNPIQQAYILSCMKRTEESKMIEREKKREREKKVQGNHPMIIFIGAKHHTHTFLQAKRRRHTHTPPQ